LVKQLIRLERFVLAETKQLQNCFETICFGFISSCGQYNMSREVTRGSTARRRMSSDYSEAWKQQGRYLLIGAVCVRLSKESRHLATDGQQLMLQ